MVQVATNEISDPYQQEIANVLGAMFGTPDDPQVLPETGLDQKKLHAGRRAGVDATPATSTHGLYRRHCVHCHGITGDGRGPTARFLNPYPRDYRKGIFKFKSTYAAAKPTDDDLRRVLHNGIPGTSMPSFSLLPRAGGRGAGRVREVPRASAARWKRSSCSYVPRNWARRTPRTRTASRSWTRTATPKMVRPPLDPATDADQAASIKESLTTVAEAWQDGGRAGDRARPRTRFPRTIARRKNSPRRSPAGRELFYGKQANCFTCHGPTALGDGQQTDYDDWTKDVVDTAKTC